MFHFFILFDNSLFCLRDFIRNIYARFLRFIAENLANSLSHHAFNGENTNRTAQE